MHWIMLHYRRVAVVAGGALLVVLGLTGSVMVINALVIGLIASFGLALLLAKTPKRIRDLMLEHPLPTDVVLSVLCFVMFGMGGTITGLAAGSVAALCVSLVLLLFSEVRKALPVG